jgi:hypothetical protein
MDYFMNQNKASEYQKWLKSDRVKELYAEFEMETGFKYLGTYFPILGFGDYDCEDWYVANDFSAFDKVRTSKAGDKLNAETWDFMDQKRLMKSRIMRTTEDVLIFEPPKEK